MLKGLALSRTVMSLLEIGRHPMTLFTISWCTRKPTPCSCLSSFPLKYTLFENVIYRLKSVFFFYDTTEVSRPNHTFCPLAFLHQILTTVQMSIIERFLANFSDLSNVCNKTSMSLTNIYRQLHWEGTQIHCGNFFLCRPLKKTTKRNDTFLQLMLRYTRHISTKCLHQDTQYPGENYSYSNRVENIVCPNFSKLAFFLKSNQRGLHVCYRCHSVLSMLPVTKFFFSFII